MKQYLTDRQHNMLPNGKSEAFKNAQAYWLAKIRGEEPGPQPHSPELEQFIGVHFPEAPCEPGELAPNAGIDSQSLTVGKLAILIAYNEAILGAIYGTPDNGGKRRTDGAAQFGINPLLPCLWLWGATQLSRADNMCISFPPDEPFQVTIEETNNINIRVSLDLHPAEGYKEWHVDGFNLYRFGNLPWALGTLCSCVVAFFVTVASNATPTLSAAISLYYSIPYSCDNHYRDLGWPPSWNGRCRLRWGDPDPAQGYACGIFSGTFKKRMGKTGTSAHRAILVLTVCVLAWIFKFELRAALGFQNAGVSGWVQVVGAVLETGVAISATFSFPVLLSWKMGKHALICIAGCIFAVVNVVLMWLWIYRGIGLLPLRVIGELGAMVLFSVFAASQLVGINYVNGATTLYVMYSWFHYISISCVLGDSRS